MKPFLDKYLNEIVGLTIMALMTVALIAGQANAGLEAYYNFEINKWLHLAGDFQLVRNQRTRNDIAVIPGFRLVIDF